MIDTKSTETTPQLVPLPPPAIDELSDTSGSTQIALSTPSVTSEPNQLLLDRDSNMDSNQDQTETHVAGALPKAEVEVVVVSPPTPSVAKEAKTIAAATKGAKNEKSEQNKKRHTKSKRKTEDSSSSDSSDADSESEEDTEEEKKKRKQKKKKRKATAKKEAAQKKKEKAKVKAKKSKSKKKSKNDALSDDNDDTSSVSTDSDSDSDSDSGSESTSSSDSDDTKRKNRRKTAKLKAKARAKAKAKAKTKKKPKKTDSSSNTSESDLSSDTSSSSSSDSESNSDNAKSKSKRAATKSKTNKGAEADATVSEGDVLVPTVDATLGPPVPGDDLNTQVIKVDAILKNLKMQQLAAATAVAAGITPPLPRLPVKKNAHEFKRIDQVWDTKLRDYKLIESTGDQKDEFECVFTVRRRFNWEGKHRETLVDIKSKTLRGVLQIVLKDCKSISLVEDIPEIDPHTLFHHYDEIKKYVKKTLKPKLKRTRKSKDQKKLAQEIAQCKLLLSYIDEDYAATRKALKPLLKAGTITYDLCWALFKPNTIVYTPTYGNKDDPRCFKVDQCFEYESWLSGAKSWVIDGRYLEYDGKVFGLGDHEVEIKTFKGHRKITSLGAYPLKYHKDPKASRYLACTAYMDSN